MGEILGGVKGHILGAQMGATSRVLLHKGATLPFTHVQTQSAFTRVPIAKKTNEKQIQITKKKIFIKVLVTNFPQSKFSLQTPR